MMGVYIKGIQMPKENQRGLWVVIHSDGTVEYDTGDYGWQTLRQSAFNVPEHGRLIDADAFLEDLLFPSKEFERGMRELVGDAPTVIPASEEGE